MNEDSEAVGRLSNYRCAAPCRLPPLSTALAKNCSRLAGCAAVHIASSPKLHQGFLGCSFRVAPDLPVAAKNVLWSWLIGVFSMDDSAASGVRGRRVGFLPA
jgi:hypothetical protein